MPPLPNALNDFMEDTRFRLNLRSYNTVFKMASSTAANLKFNYGVYDVSFAPLL
jgi:hypothetical protein